VVSDDSDRNFDGNGPRTGVLVTSKVGDASRRRGRGQQKLYMVKWVGYAQCTWETEDVVENLEALDNWLAFSRASRDADGNLPDGFRKGSPQEPLR
jgi:hypothetical protein